MKSFVNFQHGQLLGTAMLALGLLLTCGCGRGDMPELGDVSGKVTLDGKPVVGINILFTPETGRAAGGVTDEEGYYELVYLDGYSGCKVGPANVTFEWSPGVESNVSIPARYMKEGLPVTIKAGSNELDFPLDSK
ncbi:MAG: carboxypeptidase-like regulatory domain-containing protein [Planctomycetia bacterium]